jgi:hypothetical protein
MFKGGVSYTTSVQFGSFANPSRRPTSLSPRRRGGKAISSAVLRKPRHNPVRIISDGCGIGAVGRLERSQFVREFSARRRVVGHLDSSLRRTLDGRWNVGAVGAPRVDRLISPAGSRRAWTRARLVVSPRVGRARGARRQIWGRRHGRTRSGHINPTARWRHRGRSEASVGGCARRDIPTGR